MKINTLDFDAQALQNRILDLAMRGKLVPQDPTDEPASVLLDKIKVEKEELLKEKKIKKSKPLPEIADDERPFDIPDSWEWVRLGDVSEIIMGQAPKSSNVNEQGEGIEFHQGKTEFTETVIGKSSKYVVNTSKIVDSNYIIMAVRAPVGDVNLVDRKISIGRGLAGIAPYVSNKIYIFYYLESIKKYFENNSTGSTFKAINGNIIKDTIVPLPPLAEQSRIAAKIAQLFALLRKVESSIQQYANLKDLLKSKVLDLAMQGKLVPQNYSDEPASELLKKIDVEKQQLIKEGKIKKGKELPEITDEEKPFDIPNNWKWVRLGEIFDITSSKRVMKKEWRTEGVPFYRAREIVSLKQQQPLKDPIFISQKTYEEKIRVSGKPKENDVLLTGVGTLGVPYIVSTDHKFYFKDGNIIWLRNIKNKIDPLFISYYVQSPYMLKKINNGRGTTVATLTIIRAKNLLIPLPPLEEQKRIVEKIKKVLAL